MRAHIINASWGGEAFSASLREAIAAARDQGILFVAAAGNFNRDIDDTPVGFPGPVYPACFDLDNIITVAATARTDARASYSDWGLVSVHLAAPGGEHNGVSGDYSNWINGIYSTWNSSDSAYQYLVGTSMAAPHVSGALALMKAYFPTESYVQLKNRLLSSTDPLSGLSGRCQTGGRLNLNAALSTTFWRPRNDSFANAFTIARPSAIVPAITFVANNVDATKETGEPNHAGNAGGKSVWWNWTAPNNSSVTFTTSDGSGGKKSGFNTLLAIYTGSSVSSLTLVASDNDGSQCGMSQVTFTPISGLAYRIAVDGYNGAQGTIKLTLQTSAAVPTGLLFTLNSLQRPSGQFKATLTGVPTTTVGVDISSDLKTWILGYATFTFGAGGSHAYTDNGASATVRFYRASIGQPAPGCNIVGYVDRTMPVGQSMQNNPLNGNDNHVSALFAGVPAGTTISKWNDGSQAWIVNGYEFGEWSDPNMTFVPGEGFLFQNNSAGALSRSFVGEVALGHGVNQVPNLQSIRSSIVPQAGRVDTDLHLPVISGDTVSRMINGSYVTYTYSSGAWSPSEPSVSIGESFWNNKSAAIGWHRNFLVWP